MIIYLYPRLRTIGIESYSNSELNETHHHYETNVSNQSTSYQISYVIVPDMVCPNNSHISDEISYKSEEYVLDEENRDRKFDAVLIDADFSSDPLFFNEILISNQKLFVLTTDLPLMISPINVTNMFRMSQILVTLLILLF
ncbi:unnamed protein product [Schistosoma margrebowiei]|uniref:Uncharacterized protein n=1 Tax=Schistosoma margrebowiei TaxID=48269 RepID=A0A183MZB5_9TREM|nr:unnamed protein product [Schistosoma margrebowiei]